MNTTRATTVTATATSVGAVAAWGAGLILIALGAGSLTSGGATLWVGIPLVALGAGAIGWGAVSLARGRIVVPRVAMGAALAAIAASATALWVDPAGISAIAVAAASALLVVVALACGVRLRAEKTTDAPPPRLWALIAAAFVVAAVATPALSTTEAARLAPDHGSHGVTEPGHH